MTKSLTLCYPTYKRPTRVDRLIEYYSSFELNNFNIIISNNDPEVDITACYQDLPPNIQLINSPFSPNRIGNNIHNCLINTKSDFAFLLSDEDIVIGLQELIHYISHTSSDIISIKHIEDKHIARTRPKSNQFNDFIFNNHGNLSGIGFRVSSLDSIDFNQLLTMKNNDYYHILLMILLIDQGKKYVFCDKCVIFREILAFENDFMERRKEWFFIKGRIEQFDSINDILGKVKNPKLMYFLENQIKIGKSEGVSSSIIYYGFFNTLIFLLSSKLYSFIFLGLIYYFKQLPKRYFFIFYKFLKGNR